MTGTQSSALKVSRRVLQWLIALNIVWGLLILALLGASFAAREKVMGALGMPATPANAPIILGMQLVAIVGVLGVPVTHIALTRLLAIVKTVGTGDPFIAENARRMQQIAWAVLGLELLRLGVGIIAASASFKTAGVHIGWKFSPTPWLAVLLLFVLAQVFDNGSRMREDLDGTV